MHPGELLRSSASVANVVTLGASPATYLAARPGTIYVAGGTVSVLAHVRAGVSNTLGLIAGSVPLQTGDALVVTYAVIPTHVTFIPG